MLGREPFRHDLLRKYTLVFGALFNEIHLTRMDVGGVVQKLRVPLTYAPKEKILARLMADPQIDRPAATILPRMAFEMTSMTYNEQRKLRSVGRRSFRTSTVEDEEGLLINMLNPVPYDLHFTLWIFTKYQEDGNQIVEQILPYFTPHFAATLDLIEGVNVDCQVNLDSVDVKDVYDGDFKDRRSVMWTLNFTMVAYLFGPERKHPVIKFANVDFFDSSRFDSIYDSIGKVSSLDRVTVQPGMDANGQPTTNVEISVDYASIKAEDDWDYIVTIYGYLPPSPASPD